MRSLGGLLFVLGVGSLVLPYLDMQFMLLSPLDPYQPVAGIVVAAVGAVLVGLGEMRERERSAEAIPQPVASPAPSAGDPGTGGRDLSSPVPLGPASEPAAAPGSGTSAPPVITPSVSSSPVDRADQEDDDPSTGQDRP